MQASEPMIHTESSVCMWHKLHVPAGHSLGLLFVLPAIISPPPQWDMLCDCTLQIPNQHLVQLSEC